MIFQLLENCLGLLTLTLEYPQHYLNDLFLLLFEKMLLIHEYITPWS